MRPQRRLTLPFTMLLAALVLAAVLSLHGLASSPPAAPASGIAMAGSLLMHSAPEPQPDGAADAPLAAPEAATSAPPPPSVTLTTATAGSVVVPILTYHYILDVPASTRDILLFKLSTAPSLFAEQMALLHVEGATPITLATLMSAMAGHKALPPHPVVLTFDDGYVSFATAAAPVLLRYHFVGTDYVVSGFVGRSGYLSANQVTQMDREGLVIGSHTVHHVDLAGIPPALARAEIVGGKAALENLVGHPVLDFAYPYGGYNPTVEQMVRDAGFREAVTTVGGALQRAGAAFELHRTSVGGALSLATFAAAAGLPPPSAAVLAEIAREAATAVQQGAQPVHASRSRAGGSS